MASGIDGMTFTVDGKSTTITKEDVGGIDPDSLIGRVSAPLRDREPSRVLAVTESGLKRKADFGSVQIKIKIPPGVSRNQLYARLESILTDMTVELTNLLHDLGALAQFGQSAEIGAITGDFKAQPDEDITVAINFTMPNVPGASGEWQTVDRTLRNASDEIYAFMRELRRETGIDPS